MHLTPARGRLGLGFVLGLVGHARHRDRHPAARAGPPTTVPRVFPLHTRLWSVRGLRPVAAGSPRCGREDELRGHVATECALELEHLFAANLSARGSRGRREHRCVRLGIGGGDWGGVRRRGSGGRRMLWLVGGRVWCKRRERRKQGGCERLHARVRRRQWYSRHCENQRWRRWHAGVSARATRGERGG